MAYWFCSVFTVVCVVNVCRSDSIDSAWVVIVPGQKKCIKKVIAVYKQTKHLLEKIGLRLFACEFLGSTHDGLVISTYGEKDYQK